MTYDELYDHIVNYVAMPHTTITEHDKRRACLILGAFVEFILDCADQGIDPRTLDLTDYAEGKVNDLVAEMEEIK
jgi:hypothetical protein